MRRRTATRSARRRDWYDATRCTGLGQSFDPNAFQAQLTSNPDFQNGWNTVQSQLQSEGVTAASPGAAADLLQAAQLNYQESFTGIISNNIDAAAAGTVGNMAAQFTIAGHTVAGAVNTIQGLVQTAQTGTPLEIVTAFTGTLLPIAAGLGIATAGVGAAIVAAATLVFDLLDSVVGTHKPPTGQQIEPGCYTGADPAAGIAPPAFTIDYVMFLADVPQGAHSGGTAILSPGTSQWRRFPSPNANPEWFQVPTYGPWGNSFVSRMYGGEFVACLWDKSRGGIDPTISWRPIDLAFGVYRYLECEQSALSSDPNVAQFQQAFFSAWKANKEYALNGLAPQSDAQVFLHTLRLWNASHDGSTTVVLPNAGFSPSDDRSSPLFQGACPGSSAPYFSYLVEEALPAAESGLVSPDGSTLVLNSGASKQALLMASGATGGLKSSSTGMSTAGKVAVGASLAGVAVVSGIGIYASTHHLAYNAAAKLLWRKLLRKAGR